MEYISITYFVGLDSILFFHCIEGYTHTHIAIYVYTHIDTYTSEGLPYRLGRVIRTRVDRNIVHRVVRNRVQYEKREGERRRREVCTGYDGKRENIGYASPKITFSFRNRIAPSQLVIDCPWLLASCIVANSCMLAFYRIFVRHS